jgi:DNA-binding response OmpR family regulator
MMEMTESGSGLHIADHLSAEWRLLLIEDSPTYQVLVASLLEEQGFQLKVAGEGRVGLDEVRGWQPDLVLLDLGLPDIDGMSVCEEIRALSDAFIIMLTGRDDDDSRFSGLRVGADAYVTKPFDNRELLLAIEVLLRRSKPRQGLPDVVVIGALSIDRAARQVELDDRQIHLTTIELLLLERLASAHGDVVSRSDLMACLWGPNWVGDDHVISVHVANLRKNIETMRGVGYRLRVR